MPLGVNTNLAANGILSNLYSTQTMFNTEVQRLSSGLRINSAADDPAGLVISENYKAQVNGLGQSIKNAQDGINLAQTAEGAMNEISAQLQSIRTLVLHAANSTNDSNAVSADQTQITAAISQINRIVSNTQFGSQKLIDGTFSNKTFQIGAYASQTASLTVGNMASSAIGITSASTTVSSVAAIDVTSSSKTTADMLVTLDKAISDVTAQRASLGSFQVDTLQSTINSSQVAMQNMTQTESTIVDANMAQESLSFSKAQILQQTGLAMLAQANQAPQQLLTLFR